MATEAAYLEASRAIVEGLYAGGGAEKRASDAVTEFTRIRLREDGFMDKIITPVDVNNSDLHRQLNEPRPVIIIDKEPDSPGAISVAFGTLPDTYQIQGPRYAVMFERILSPRYTQDAELLRTYTFDIRQVLSDNAVKDMLAERDGKWIRATNNALGGAADAVVAWSQIPQWETLTGGVGRSNLEDALSIMPRTLGRLEVKTALVNMLFFRQIAKMNRIEMGGDFAETLLRKGWQEEEFLGIKWVSTIKRELVPDNSMFMYGDQRFIGKNYVLEKIVMYAKREAFLMEFFMYGTFGATIGHSAGIARADFRN